MARRSRWAEESVQRLWCKFEFGDSFTFSLRVLLASDRAPSLDPYLKRIGIHRQVKTEN